MANLRDLVRRIQSVKGTQQITKAMKMVAAAKLRRAQEAISEARPWAETLSKVLANVAARTEFSHPLLEAHEGERTWVVVVSSDKGLCGSFNTNILRAVEKDLLADRWPEVELAVVGKKASDYFRSRRWNLVVDDRETMSAPTAEAGPRLGKRFVEAFTSGEVDSVWLAYNSFVNMIRQDLVVDRLLPIEPPTVAEEVEDDSGRLPLRAGCADPACRAPAPARGDPGPAGDFRLGGSRAGCPHDLDGCGNPQRG